VTTTRRPMQGPDREVVALVADLVRIDSSNPTLAPQGSGESTIADYCAAWLSTRGFTTVRLESTPGRPSILATGAGRGGGRSIMLNGHLDTVSLAAYDGDPLDPVVDDGRLRGRGSYDMKAGIAAMMVAAARAHHQPHDGDVVLALVADEEDASIGTEEVLTHLRAAGTEIDAAVVAEPTGLDLVTCHKGFVWADVTLTGVAAHGSRPDLGVDAIAKAGAFLTGLDRLASELGTRPGHAVLGAGSVHVGVIDGGQETSSYPDRCRITVERRTVPGEDTAVFEAELRAILDPIIGAQPGLGATVVMGLERRPLDGDPTRGITPTLSTVVADVTGRPAHHRGEAFWTDAALLADAGIPAVLFGVDGAGAHASTEWVDLGSLHDTARVMERAITAWTGMDGTE
jgi:acetylornithine deacetylase